MKKVVLIVEDDESIRTLYTEALSNADFEVLQAENGEGGVLLALEHHPDVILMDIILPDISGHIAVNKIRKDDWGKDAKIIYLTNMSDAENVVHAVEQGSEKYIVKANAEVKDVVNQVRIAAHK